MHANFQTAIKWFLLIRIALLWNPRLEEFVGESWKLLAHLRAQQSYCNAAFMTFQNIKLERGFCSSKLIVFLVGVKSFQQVFFPALPRSQGPPWSGGGGGGQASSASLFRPRLRSRSRVISHAWWQFRWDQGAKAAQLSIIWPLPADWWHCASQWRAPRSAGLRGQRGGGPNYPA